ncbi:MAG: Flp family type IVb pilin [Planctomycetaceae bacterium]
MNRLLRFLKSEDGPTTVEYALMLALILLAAFSTLTALGSRCGASFDAARRY